MKLFNALFSRQKKTTIEFCQKNLDRFLTGTDIQEYESFFNHKAIIVKEYECQSRCGQCLKSPYAIVDGRFLAAEDAMELLESLKREAASERN